MNESESEPIHIPTSVFKVVARLNDRLVARRQCLHYDSASNERWLLIDLAKAKPLTPAQLETLARETGTLDPSEVISYPSGLQG